MNEENTIEIVRKFPRLFRCGMTSFDCDDGWADLIYDTCRYISNYVNTLSLSENDYPYFAFIKQKFGGLRMGCVFHGSKQHQDAIYGIIDDAIDLSFKICERCGEPGELCRRGNWVATLCDDHAAEEGYVKNNKDKTSKT